MDKTILTRASNSRGEIFYVKDWVLHDFQIKQLKEIRQYVGNSTIHVDVSCGVISCGTAIDDIYTLTMTRKIIAEGVANYYEKLNQIPNERHLNWPDIKRKLIHFAYTGYEMAGLKDWNEQGRSEQETDAERQRFSDAVWTPLANFVKSITDIMATTSKTEVAGVKILR